LFAGRPAGKIQLPSAASAGGEFSKEVLMKRMKMFALASVVCAGALAMATPSMANHGGCHKIKNPICPAIFDPVTCDNGKTYTNQCFANADCATGCTSGEPI
jgi:hypothetical protein